MSLYQRTYQHSIEHPETFWAEQAKKLPWYTPPSTILTYDDQQHARWFGDGELNICYAAIDYHVEQGRGDQPAIYWDSPVTQSKQTINYLELRDRVARFAGGLAKLGVTKGDRVIIYMPMVPEALIAMYACARLGAVHSVVFGGVDKVLPYKPIVEKAISLSSFKPDACVVFQREAHRAELQPGDVDWQELVADAPFVDCVPVKATDPLYVLYTSGTTGKPKGVVRDTGGYAVALAYSMEVIYDLNPGDVMFTASDVGWVVGHSYIVYAPLLRGCTTKKEDPDAKQLEKYDISSLQHLYVAGERLDPPTFHWLDDLFDVPVIDHWWQTETGWPIAANLPGIEVTATKAGSATYPVPGFNVQILDRDGEQAPAMQQGSVVIKQPLPPGCLVGVWRDPQRFHSAYMAAYPGYYLTGDGGYFDEEGYLFIMGRTDDVINVAGHRLSTGEMEEVVGAHPAVAECAVIGIHDELKGQLPVGLVIPKDGFNGDEATLEAELIERMRQHIGPIACFKQVLVVNRLPKTRSGKILRKLLRNIADGKSFGIPSTIDDPTSLEDVHAAMRERNVGAADQATSTDS